MLRQWAGTYLSPALNLVHPFVTLFLEHLSTPSGKYSLIMTFLNVKQSELIINLLSCNTLHVHTDLWFQLKEINTKRVKMAKAHTYSWRLCRISYPSSMFLMSTLLWASKFSFWLMSPICFWFLAWKKKWWPFYWTLGWLSRGTGGLNVEVYAP